MGEALLQMGRRRGGIRNRYGKGSFLIRTAFITPRGSDIPRLQPTRKCVPWCGVSDRNGKEYVGRNQCAA